MRTKSNQKQSLVFFTHAPQGTLGDPSAAAKLIKSLKLKYDDNIDITIALIVNKENEKTVRNIFNGIDIKVITMPTLDLEYKTRDKHNKEVVIDDILKRANGIIFFPTFHHFATSDIQKLGTYYKPTFVVTEYDLHPKNKLTQAEKLGDFKSRCMEIYTGLAKDKLGIFCTEEQDTSNNRSSLAEITDSSDKAFQAFLLSGTTAERYHDHHQLFFGYFNKLDMELDSQKVNPAMFIEGCLATASAEKDFIDIVLPLKENKESDPKKNLRNKSVEELLEYFKKNPSLLEGYRFEFWQKNKDGKMTPLSKGGTGKKLIRFINGFPFTPNTMNKLMKASNEFVLITGDQSLSEAISNEKIFLYQTMSWKQELWNGLKERVKEYVGESSELYRFLLMQGKSSKLSTKNFRDFLSKNKTILLEQIKQFHKSLLEHRNLYDTLPEQLVTYMNSPKTYLNDCLKHSETLDYNQIKDLIYVFPDEISTLLGHVLENDLFSAGAAELATSFAGDVNSFSKDQLEAIKAFFVNERKITIDIKSNLNNTIGIDRYFSPLAMIGGAIVVTIASYFSVLGMLYLFGVTIGAVLTGPIVPLAITVGIPLVALAIMAIKKAIDYFLTPNKSVVEEIEQSAEIVTLEQNVEPQIQQENKLSNNPAPASGLRLFQTPKTPKKEEAVVDNDAEQRQQIRL